MKQLTLFALLLLGLFLTPLALAADPDDYEYRTPYTVTNTGASAFSGFVCAPVTITGLSGGGFMGADALDAAAFDTTGSTELTLLRTATASGDGCFFVTTSVNAGQSATFDLHTGGVDNAQVLDLSVSESITTPDHSDLDPVVGAGEITLYLDSWTIDALPSVARSIFDKSGSYGFALLSNGDIRADITLSAGSCTTLGTSYTFGATITTDHIYDIIVAFRARSTTNTCSYYLRAFDHTTGDDNILQSSSNTCTSCQMANSANALNLNSTPDMNTTLKGARMGNDYYPSGENVLMHWDFTTVSTLTATDSQPSSCTVSAEDQVDGDNDGAYTFTCGPSSGTVTASPLRWKTALDTATVSTTLADLTGTLPSIGSATATSDTFTGDDGLESTIAFMGLPSDVGWFLFAFIIASTSGILLARFIGGWVGAVWMGFAMGVPATDAFAWYGWVWVAIGGMMCFGAAGVAAYFGKR